MTNEEIDAMPAGREMDLLIARRVMAHMEPFALYQVSCPDGKIGCGVNHQDWFDANRVRIPRYSTDIGAAWQVVEKMEDLGYWCQTRTPFGPVGSKNHDGYWAGFTPHLCTGWNGRPDNWTNAHTLPLAICRAALKTPLEQVDCHKITTTSDGEPTKETG